MATQDVWSNPGGTPGMPIVKIERDSEAWRELRAALDQPAGYIRISAANGELTVKVGEGSWSWPLDVAAPAHTPTVVLVGTDADPETVTLSVPEDESVGAMPMYEGSIVGVSEKLRDGFYVAYLKEESGLTHDGHVLVGPTVVRWQCTSSCPHRTEVTV
jgi:hypothetical protein